MARLSPAHTRKLAAFVTSVVISVVGIFALNRTVRDRDSALSIGGRGRLVSALERLRRDPDRWAMTMAAGLPDERLLRHLDARLIDGVDVLALGQSDADHMSTTFFADGVRFYNGFLSSSFFAYQYEVFEDVERAHGAPDIVLLAVRSGYMLSDGDEPAYDAPADDKVWWAGAPWSRGEASTPWYRDVDSLLSWTETEHSFGWLAGRFARRWGGGAPVDVDPGSPFRVVPKDGPASTHRWLADGSRIYPGEVDGVVVAGEADRIDYSTGDRRLNALRVTRLGEYLARLRRAGSKVIAYSPPLSPRVFEERAGPFEFLGVMAAAVGNAADQEETDYCDLTRQARALGCAVADFYDALHLSRACNERVVRRLAGGCARRTGGALRQRLSPAVLRD